ncbi:MAG: PH domain-containing protein [Actinobacteria bacterium]|nr:PH domain-containing protein [Actinomycetota bacterium]MCL6104361.1 PH domain-containing protein [Actinomycetota bacterium]
MNSQDIMNEGEELVAEIRLHWVFIIKPFALSLALIALSIAIFVLFPKAPIYVAIVLGGLVVLSVMWLLVKAAKWHSKVLLVTSSRLIYQEGVLSKKGQDFRLSRLNDISFSQPFFLRIVGAGTLVIETGGEQSQRRFSPISRPREVLSLINEQIEAQSQGGMVASGHEGIHPNNVKTIPEQIEQLNELCVKGIITREEFESKKAQLLQRM